MLVVIDTNILVSSLWKPNSNSSKVLDLVRDSQIFPCYNFEIFEEYEAVLSRPRLKFDKSDVFALLDLIKSNGKLSQRKQSDRNFVDESDRKFYEVALFCNCNLITGNMKHFPDDDIKISLSSFLNKFSNQV